MILNYVSKDKLRNYWSFVRNGLEIVRTKGHMDWIPEDVYCDCHENRSMLFIGIKDNNPYGLVVLQPMGTAMHIWAAWSTNQNDADFHEAWEEIQQIARNGNKTRITFTSARRGWERKAKALNFTPTTWTYKL